MFKTGLFGGIAFLVGQIAYGIAKAIAAAFVALLITVPMILLVGWMFAGY
jgi:hypothetical protein